MVIIIHKSILKSVKLNAMGFTIDVKPSTVKMLKIFDPMMFPTEISLSFLTAAIIEAVSSGTLVPNATTVIDITRSLIPISAASDEAPVTSNLEPTASPTDAKTIMRKYTHGLYLFLI